MLAGDIFNFQKSAEYQSIPFNKKYQPYHNTAFQQMVLEFSRIKKSKFWTEVHSICSVFRQKWHFPPNPPKADFEILILIKFWWCFWSDSFYYDLGALMEWNLSIGSFIICCWKVGFLENKTALQSIQHCQIFQRSAYSEILWSWLASRDGWDPTRLTCRYQLAPLLYLFTPIYFIL